MTATRPAEDDHQDQKRRKPRNQAPPEHIPDTDLLSEEPPCGERPDDCTQMICRPMESERAAPQFRRRHVGNHRISCRRTRSLPHTIQHPESDYLPPGASQGHEWTNQDRAQVSPQDERFPPPRPIGHSSTDPLDEGSRHIGGTIQRPKNRGSSAQSPGDECRAAAGRPSRSQNR